MGASLSKLMVKSSILLHAIDNIPSHIIINVMRVPGAEMNVPVVSPARAATVATFAWTKLHAQIMS